MAPATADIWTRSVARDALLGSGSGCRAFRPIEADAHSLWLGAAPRTSCFTLVSRPPPPCAERATHRSSSPFVTGPPPTSRRRTDFRLFLFSRHHPHPRQQQTRHAPTRPETLGWALSPPLSRPGNALQTTTHPNPVYTSPQSSSTSRLCLCLNPPQKTTAERAALKSLGPVGCGSPSSGDRLVGGARFPGSARSAARSAGMVGTTGAAVAGVAGLRAVMFADR